MITAEGIKKANEDMKRTPIKGKNYATVPARVAAFREMCPMGSITTQIIKLEDGIVTMMTTVKDETGLVLSTGLAQEKENSTYINKTSYIENCETSAVGRALGMLGIGSDADIATAEEVANAINSQQSPSEAPQGVSRGKARKSPQNTQNALREPSTAVSDVSESDQPITEKQIEVLKRICAARKMNPETVFVGWPVLTQEQYGKALKRLDPESKYRGDEE